MIILSVANFSKMTDSKLSDIFLKQENLSSLNFHINWFCLTELDLQHI